MPVITCLLNMFVLLESLLINNNKVKLPLTADKPLSHRPTQTALLLLLLQAAHLTVRLQGRPGPVRPRGPCTNTARVVPATSGDEIARLQSMLAPIAIQWDTLKIPENALQSVTDVVVVGSCLPAHC